jgi:hypothetical protein
MATIKDLTDWVDLHPDDYEQRWWLAKKLYKNSEYEPALEHLLILRKRWTPKLNVARYLAATYYRLGKYPEAIAELETAVEDWPEEIPVREQLARVLEVAGRKEGAATVWREVLKLKPSHAMAEQALARLPRMTPPPREAPALKDSDFGIGFGSGRTCEKCGALNTEDREQCWKCDSVLYDYDAEPLTPDPKPATPPGNLEYEPPAGHATAVWNTVGTVGIAVMLALGAFVSLRQLSASYEMHVARTPQELWSLGMLLTRVSIGGALLVGWPVALWVGLTVSRAGVFNLKPVAVTGLLFASLSYAALSMPLGYIGALLVALMAVSLGPIMLLFNIDFGRSLIVWAIQCVLVGAIVAIAFGAMEGALAVQELPAVLRYAGGHRMGPNAGSCPLPAMTLPADIRVRWQPTGSTWLDQRAGQAEIVFSSTTSSKKIQIELTDENGKVVHEEINTVPFGCQVKIIPDRTYTLRVSGTDGMTVEGSILGAITPRIGV